MHQHHHKRTTAHRRRRLIQTLRTRRGVVGILAMMFLVLFGSLAVAMASVSQGNLRTATTNKRIIRAQGAVDTALGIAKARLADAAARFVAAKGDITPAYATQLWYGTYPSTPPVTVLPPADGRTETIPPTGIAEALTLAHQADATSNLAIDITLSTPPVGWVRGAPIGVEKDANGRVITAAQVDYAPPDSLGRVLVVATGYEWDWLRDRWVTRTSQEYFKLTKTVPHAIIASSRIMLGRNVQINGPLGVRYNSQALDTLDGPPLVTRSDFYGLSPILDRKLDDFYAAVLADDLDGNNQLRAEHPIESRSLAAMNLNDYDNDNIADQAFGDADNDHAVSDFDVFIHHFDTNNDGKLVLAPSLTAGTPNAALPAEFTLDNALAEMIDSGVADRNGNGMRNGQLINGVWQFTTFDDNNADGIRDAADIDLDDVVLGYRDGVIDARDRYAKIHGSLMFKSRRADWEASADSTGMPVMDYQKFVQGPISASRHEDPVSFEVSDDQVPPFTQDSFAAAAATMANFHTQTGVDSQPFNTQVTNAKGAGWTPPIQVEATPFGSPTPADWYGRPVYDNIVFRNVTIPMGNNGLFRNCTFIGVTRVEAYVDNTHPSWAFYGEERRDPVTGVLSLVYPPPPAASDAALDKSYVDPAVPNYASLPDPLMVNIDLNGDTIIPDQVTNTKLLANNIRFDGCLFIGSIVADKPTNFANIRNKIQFTGATRFTDTHPDFPADATLNLTDQERVVTKLSSMMLPHYSVDIGTNNSPTTQDVRLNGAVIAGILDVRGNAAIKGALLLTFEPVYGQAPLVQYGSPLGNPAQFNVTLGYFGPQDGDEEGIDLTAMTDLDGDGNLDVGWDSARDATGALVPAGTLPVLSTWFDGIPDTDADPVANIRQAIPFNGFGKITFDLDENLVLPDGLAAPITIQPLPDTYLEGKFAGP